MMIRLAALSPIAVLLAALLWGTPVDAQGASGNDAGPGLETLAGPDTGIPATDTPAAIDTPALGGDAPVPSGELPTGELPAVELPAGDPAGTRAGDLDNLPGGGVAYGPRPQIEWRVENPFRLFSKPADTEMHRATWLSLSPEERRTPILSVERALSLRHTDGWAAIVVDDTCWNAKTNRYECPDADEPFATPSQHAIIAQIANVPDASLVNCNWLTAPNGGKRLRGMAVMQPCDQPVVLKIPYPYGATIEVRVGDRPIAVSQARVKDLFIVGMGDSFGSGEGNPDIPVRFSRERSASYGKDEKQTDLAGYPARVGEWSEIGDKAFIKQNARWIDQACHRSLYSHQLRAALQLSIEDPHRAVTYIGLACSGAEITAGLFLRYKGNEWVPDPPDLSQISAAAVAQCGPNPTDIRDMPEAYHIGGTVGELEGGLILHKCPIEKARAIDLVFLSIGGNDIGFARLLANAVLNDQSLLKKLGGWLGQVHGQSEASSGLATLDERYKALNRAIHGILHLPWSQSDRVILAAYPGLALLGDGSDVCPDGSAGMEIVSDFNLSTARAREGVWMADKLHRKMEASAQTHGWSFAAHHRRQFIGRGICAGFSDAAFSIADDLRVPRKIDGRWVPYNPADYRAYVPRQRWFRTPNDAYLTGNFHVSASLLQKVLKLGTFSWFQLLLASTYSGAFHPTAEGHAAMADAVTERARAVLDKYAPRTLQSAMP